MIRPRSTPLLFSSVLLTGRCGCIFRGGLRCDLGKTYFFLAAAAASFAGVCTVIWVKRIFLWPLRLHLSRGSVL